MTASDSASGQQEQARVGVVLVSHSAAVAHAVAEMTAAMTGSGTTGAVVPAGGTADGGMGTDAVGIEAAIRQAGQGAGVAVLVDLGSAVLTVKSLLEDEEDFPGPVRLVDAPFVEGAVAAVVTASTGAELDAVSAAAQEAYDYRKR